MQIVHYPSFRFVEEKDFVEFHDFHSWRITWVVGPLMAGELFTAIALYLQNTQPFLDLLNLTSVILLWALTMFVSVPIHKQLAQKKSIQQIKRLVITNWPRTVLWSLRFVALSAVLLNDSGFFSLQFKWLSVAGEIGK